MGAGWGTRGQIGVSNGCLNPWKLRRKLILFEGVGPWHHQARPQIPGTFMYTWVEKGGYLRVIDIWALHLKIRGFKSQLRHLSGVRPRKYLTVVGLTFFIGETKILAVVSVKCLWAQCLARNGYYRYYSISIYEASTLCQQQTMPKADPHPAAKPEPSDYTSRFQIPTGIRIRQKHEAWAQNS